MTTDRAALEPPDGAKVRLRPSLTSWLRARVTSAEVQSDALQVLKTVVASVAAWVLADGVLHLADAFLAPWVALLTVRATLHRSLWGGVETVVAVAAGLLVSYLTVQVLGPSPWSLGVAVAAGLVVARLRWFRREGVMVATTALFVITAGEAVTDERAAHVLPDRLLATALGVVVALVVNLVVLPPLDDRSAQAQVDRVDRELGALVRDIASGLRGRWTAEHADAWVERSREIDGDVDRAWSLVRYARESRRWNPRRARHPATVPGTYADVLERLEEGVAQVRGIARHLRESSHEPGAWDPRFRTRFVDLLDELGRRMADPEADVAALRGDLDTLAADLATVDLSAVGWPLYGALIANARTIVQVVDDVATARPVRT